MDQIKRLLSATILATLVIGLGFAGVANAQGNEKVTICHKGQTITVSENALDAHLGHGDTRGACEAAPSEVEEPAPEPVDEDVTEYVRVSGAIVYYNPSTGILRLQDGTIVILQETPDFAIQTGMMVLVQGEEIMPGYIVAVLITTDLEAGDIEPQEPLPVSLQLTGEVSQYDAEFGTFKLEGISVILASEPDFTIENGMLLTVSGELLPDGRLLVDSVVIYEPAQDDDDVVDLPESGTTTICHVPPGNSNNAHTITVGAAAVPAHLDHGDYMGPCGEGDEELDDDVTIVEPVCDGPCNPELLVLADAFEVRYVELAELQSRGYPIGVIARFYIIAKLADVDVNQIVELYEAGNSWDAILAQFPDVTLDDYRESSSLGDGRG